MKPPLLILALSMAWTVQSADFPAIYNSEKGAPLRADEAVQKFRLPDGFTATVFASEPDVQQPIAMTFDSRGRLWVAENYTYAEATKNFDRTLRDRILIFEDTDHDGRFDVRKVFWDQAQLLTSIELGFGGVWALCAPKLLFIPDRDGDDVPDGEPEVLLDGWDTGPVRHNIVNGLKWGPDGWLYGRHGIQATSRIGPPGALPEQRTPVNCAIWRFHPTRRTFEVVARGTTNPWGMDWNELGEGFFINTVIGHLWHLIPGAHYRRMYGEDFDPDLYELIDQHADHYHWNTSEAWSDVRKGVTASSSAAGGGHAHIGLMIYLGENWPQTYRGHLFTLNMHGRRINEDRLEHVGSGYVGRHETDKMFSDDTWFRGIDLTYGPDGGVYILDWSDTGECHEQDAVHRTSGRIYKISYGQPKDPGRLDLAQKSNAELVKLLAEGSEWFARQSRRLLHERAASHSLSDVEGSLKELVGSKTSASTRLRALWALYATGGTSPAWLRSLLQDQDESIRVWAIRLLTDQWPLGRWSGSAPAETLEPFVRLGSRDSSAAVRLALASSLQRIAPKERVALASALVAHGEDATDHNLPLMLWYGAKGIIEADATKAVSLAQKSEIPLVRRFLSRRLAETIDAHSDAVSLLLKASAENPRLYADVVQGLSEGLRGRRSAPRPESWEAFEKAADNLADAKLQSQVKALALVFGSGRALEELQVTALDDKADLATRKTALQTLIDQRAPGLRRVCERLLNHRELAGLAAGGLAQIDDPAVAELLAAKYSQLHALHKQAVLAALVSRPNFARVLLNNVGSEPGSIPRTDITAFHARQINSFGDSELTRLLSKVWGQVRETDTARREVIAHYRQKLTPQRLKGANLDNGHALFKQVCATCHTLYGEGGAVGPDLTGSGRDNLDYLLENVIDPSGLVPEAFRMSIVSLKDGRVFNGVVLRQTARTIDLQTITERSVIPRDDIESIEQSNLSLMPEGLLTPFSEDQVRDLLGFLMNKPKTSQAIAP